MKGRIAAAEEQHNLAMKAAYYTAAIPTLKKPPKLDDLLIRRGKPERPAKQTPAEMLTAMRVWAQATRH
jgi:hypothetical protein